MKKFSLKTKTIKVECFKNLSLPNQLNLIILYFITPTIIVDCKKPELTNV